MKLVVMSDSHTYDEAIDEVISANGDADVFIHCGDFCSDPHKYPEMLIVRGNWDDDESLPWEIIRQYNGVRFLIAHGHRTKGDIEATLVARAKAEQCQVVLYGHTHYPYDKIHDGIRLINPGSLLFNMWLIHPGYTVIDLDEDGNLTAVRKDIKKPYVFE